ncbi:hypothetical protein NLI96_g5315 [Meripilus lineatus]|uniref:DUF6533 domain-containing protein n=1 Tax=Meripilus lineatus TaxID=2056292 RepID=A0AAD5V8J6_9APHY|nr:hypothetical protein NLI96_g5315 [Physisporinus lineatus]
MSLNSPWTPDPAKFSELADGFRVIRYIAVATYAAWLWDSFLTLSDDIRLFREFKSSLTDVVYLFSRISAFAFLTATVSFLCTVTPLEGSDSVNQFAETAMEAKCHDAVKPMIWLSMISLPPNSLLFVIRIRAVFYDSKITQGFFATLWLSVLAGALIQPFCVTFNYSNVFHTCIATTVRPYCTSGAITVMLHDTMVLLAISTKIILQTFVGSWKEKLKTFFSTNEMPQVSRLLVRTGQQYYL